MERRHSSRGRGTATRRRKRRVAKRFLVFVVSVLMVAAAVVLLIVANNRKKAAAGTVAGTSAPQTTTGPDGQIIQLNASAPTPVPTPEPTPAPMTPSAAESTKPSVMGVRQQFNLDGNDVDSYTRSEAASFGGGDGYTELEGIITFRGNNYRDSSTSGTASISEGKFEKVWEVKTDAIPKGEGGGNRGYWTGAGWTGQPLIVRWPESTRKAMNINDEKKNKDGLVEVIYAIEDGNIYFLDLEDGTRTRSKLKMGQTFKGSGSLDPRGYPILYVGGGDSTPNKDGFKEKSQRFFMINLLNCETMYEFGVSPDPYSQRKWHAYDGGTAVDADTDMFFAPGENGIFYSMKLNTKYDEAAGTLSLDPKEFLKMRYSTSRTREYGDKAFWVGMETSPVFYGEHMYVADNGGNLFCININTMKVVWAADCLDDTNGSPVLEIENGHPYLYLSTSLHWTKDDNDRGIIPLWKFDGVTGEVVWKQEYDCATVNDVSGGVQSTALVGKGTLGDLVFFSVSRTPRTGSGILVALNKKTGDKAWELALDSYAWSSPVAVYGEDGKGYVVLGEQSGRLHLIDGLSGEKLDTIRFTQQDSEGKEVGQTIEATPAVFGNMLVIGTRAQWIFGIRIK